MDAREIIIKYNHVGINDRIDEFKFKMYVILKEIYGGTVIMETLNYPKIIEGLPTTKISAILLSDHPIDVEITQKALNGLIDDYREYYNVTVYLSI